jgi:hypothetical protein
MSNNDAMFLAIKESGGGTAHPFFYNKPELNEIRS